MSRVLKLLNRGVIIDELTNTIILGGGKTIIPVIRNPLGIFVEGTKENEHLLYVKGEGYLPGHLDDSGPFPIFTRLEPFQHVQSVIDCDLDLGVSLPRLSKENMHEEVGNRVDTLSMLIEKELSFIKSKISVVALYSVRNKIYEFEVFQYRPGHVKGLHLIHKVYGLMKVVLRPTSEQHKVMLEQKYRMIPAIKPTTEFDNK